MKLARKNKHLSTNRNMKNEFNIRNLKVRLRVIPKPIEYPLEIKFK